MEITNDEFVANLPDALARLLMKHKGWHVPSDEDRARIAAEEAERQSLLTVATNPDEEGTEAEAEVVVDVEPAEPAPPAGDEDDDDDEDDGLDPAAACDDDLPDGVTFADSAYVIDKETGERVLKTHCRNGHSYLPNNVKLKLRGDKAYRECQTCLSGRKARAAAKKAAAKAG